MSDEGSRPKASAAATQNLPKLKWDDASMKSSYANVCNVASTREEVVLLFGMHQAWQGGQKEVTVQLTDRIVLNPYAAKRLAALLNNVLKNHEARYGALNVEPGKVEG